MRGTGEHRSKMRGTWEQKQFWGTGNIENQHFCFWEQENKAIYFRGQREHVSSLEESKKMYVLLNLF